MNEPKWLNLEALIDLHDLQIKLHGGTHGTRDLDLLKSALAQPQQAFSYQEPTPNEFELAATYAFGICKNHPFFDGNKRAALVASLLFLSINGYTTHLPEQEAYILFRSLAAGRISRKELATWLQQHSKLKNKLIN